MSIHHSVSTLNSMHQVALLVTAVLYEKCVYRSVMAAPPMPRAAANCRGLPQAATACHLVGGAGVWEHICIQMLINYRK